MQGMVLRPEAEMLMAKKEMKMIIFIMKECSGLCQIKMQILLHDAGYIHPNLNIFLHYFKRGRFL